MRDELDEDELDDEEDLLAGDDSLLDDEDKEFGLDDKDDDDEDPLKNGFTPLEEEDEFGF